MASALQDTADLLRFGEGWVFMSYEFGFVSRSVDPDIPNDDSHSTIPICPELLRAG